MGSPDVAKAFEEFFICLLGKQKELVHLEHFNLLSDRPDFNEAQAKLMEGKIMDNEIKAAMFNIIPKKSPGLDGFNPYFCQDAWHIMGPHVIKAIRYIFEHGLNRNVIATNICLIPKVQCPLYASYFRPISCVNVFYKFYSKIVTKRLKRAIPDLISSLQSTFVLGRDIHDNLLLGLKLISGYN